MTWQNNSKMLHRRAKSVILLHLHLKMARLKGSSTAQINAIADLPYPTYILFLWKGQNRPYKLKGRNHQTPTKNNITIAANKDHGKWF